MTDSTSTGQSLTDAENNQRAGTYALLAALLRAPLGDPLRQQLRQIDASAGDRPADDALAHAWAALRAAAESAELDAVDDEFHTLFIGMGRGELVPYGSWYLTGFLMEKPLGELRVDLRQLGFEREAEVSEPEDHIAALCEVMSLLIGDPATPLSVQKKFFLKHIDPWAGRFFMDLSDSQTAVFYRAVGALGGAYVAFEKQFLTF